MLFFRPFFPLARYYYCTIPSRSLSNQCLSIFSLNFFVLLMVRNSLIFLSFFTDLLVFFHWSPLAAVSCWFYYNFSRHRRHRRLFFVGSSDKWLILLHFFRHRRRRHRRQVIDFIEFFRNFFLSSLVSAIRIIFLYFAWRCNMIYISILRLAN